MKSDSMKVAEKKHNPNRWIYYDVKSTLTFRFQSPSSGLGYQNSSHSDGCLLRWQEQMRNIQRKDTCCVLLNKREVLSRFFGKSNIFKYFSPYQTRSYDFWIMNTICTFMYVFVVYFSFAPVISVSIHRYVNYFDIQVLMMVTETETLTLTLHHNIFTYLDNAFFCYLHIYIYIYIYIINIILLSNANSVSFPSHIQYYFH